MTIAALLAALVSASAYGAPASAAKTRGRASSARPAHRAGPVHRVSQGRPQARSQAGRRSERRTSTTGATGAHRPTPEEVGRAAGLRIRREMARESIYGREFPREAHLRRIPYRVPNRGRRTGAVRVSERAYRPEAAHPESARLETPPADAAPPDNSNAAAWPSEAASRPRFEESARSGDPGTARSVAATDGATANAARPDLDQPARSTPKAVAGETPRSSEDESGSEPESAEEPAPEPSGRAGAGDEVATLSIPRGAMPPPLRGSLASLERQNDRLTAEGLERIEDEDDLAARIANRLLVPVPASAALTVNPDLPLNHRYCRPWTARFLADLAQAHEAVFHRPLNVSSAVRTVAYQKHLMGINGNAAPAEGDVVSPHLTGAAVDIAKDGLTREEMAWMRRRLAALEAEGKIDVEEEFQQACFHITVYKSYAPPRAVRHPSRAHNAAPGSRPADPGEPDPGEAAAQG